MLRKYSRTLSVDFVMWMRLTDNDRCSHGNIAQQRNGELFTARCTVRCRRRKSRISELLRDFPLNRASRIESGRVRSRRASEARPCSRLLSIRSAPIRRFSTRRALRRTPARPLFHSQRTATHQKRKLATSMDSTENRPSMTTSRTNATGLDSSRASPFALSLRQIPALLVQFPPHLRHSRDFSTFLVHRTSYLPRHSSTYLRHISSPSSSLCREIWPTRLRIAIELPASMKRSRNCSPPRE